MKCFGIIVKGETAPTLIGDRVPSCLGMDGGFRGPFTYDQLVKGESVTLASGQYTVAIVGFNNVSTCGNSISDLFNSTVAADTYSIGESASFAFPTSSEITVSSSSYVPATAVNRTPSCPPQTASCVGYTACDTFDAVNGTYAGSRAMDSGLFWQTSVNLLNGQITDQVVDITSTDPFGGLYSVLGVTVARDISIRALVNLGETTTGASVGLVARFGGVLNFARGEVYRLSSPPSCSLRISETTGGAYFLRASLSLAMTECPVDTFSQMEFIAIGVNYTLNYRGYSLAYGNAQQVLGFTVVGLTSSQQSTVPIKPQRAKLFQAK